MWDWLIYPSIPSQERLGSRLGPWMYTDIKGWTLASSLDDDQFDRLQREAERALQHFVSKDGSVRFEAPAHILTANKM